MPEFELRGLVHISPVIFGVARAAAEMALRDGRHETRDALVAIVFSASAVEALVGEVAESALFWRAHGIGGEEAVRFATAMEELEQARTSAQLKMRIGAVLLAGTTFDESASPFSDYLLLVGLRNALLHLRPSRLGGSVFTDQQVAAPLQLRVPLPDVFRRLQALGVMPPIPAAAPSWPASVRPCRKSLIRECRPGPSTRPRPSQDGTLTCFHQTPEELALVRDGFAPISDPMAH